MCVCGGGGAGKSGCVDVGWHLCVFTYWCLEQGNLSKTATCGPVLTDHDLYREVTALQRYSRLQCF